MVVIVDRILMMGLLYIAAIQALRLVGVYMWFRSLSMEFCSVCRYASYILMEIYMVITLMELLTAHGYVSTQALPSLLTCLIAALSLMILSECINGQSGVLAYTKPSSRMHLMIAIFSIGYPIFTYLIYFDAV